LASPAVKKAIWSSSSNAARVTRSRPIRRRRARPQGGILGLELASSDSTRAEIATAARRLRRRARRRRGTSATSSSTFATNSVGFA